MPFSDLFLEILVTVQNRSRDLLRFSCLCVRDYTECLIKIQLIMLFPKPRVKHSIEFSSCSPSY